MTNFYHDCMKDAKEWTKQAYAKWGCEGLVDITRIKWNDRFKSTAGRAIPSKKLIELSVAIWPHFSHDERYSTVIHEAAHIAAPVLHMRGLNLAQKRGLPKIGHGIQWKRLMWDMGLPAERCHKIDTFKLGISKRRGPKTKTKFIYRCDCSDGVDVGPLRHKRIKKEGRKYTCVCCGIRLDRTTPYETRTFR